ncbi:MAG: DUF202 domain-containing protein [Thermoanaerobaculia bacterium]|nr:DUF202 domain-containing protein [Thermoanaerobaculia bacterium]
MNATQPDPRVLFAAERTLLAWIRTGLAMMGFGFVVARFGLFLRELAAMRGPTVVQEHLGSVWAGIALVLLGALINVVAPIQYARIMRSLREGTDGSVRDQFRFAMIVAVVLAIFGFATAAYLAVAT